MSQMKGSIPRISLATLLLVAGTDAFAPPSRMTAKIAARKQPIAPEHPFGNGGFGFRHYASSTSDDDCTEIHEINRSLRLRLKTLAQRKSKPVSYAIATATAFLSCLPGQSLFKPLPAQASAPIVLREKLAKDDPPMVQAMTKAKELKKKKSMEEFDAFMQKLNDIEDKEGKKARDAYEKQYQADKETAAAQKAVDLDKLKRDLLDEGKDPNTYLDAEREVFLFEHDVDLAKVPGTPHNEQMIKNFRAKGKNQPTYDSQIYIVKCQVADLKARGVDPLEHFSQPDVKDKTRAIYYKMKNAEAVKIAKQYDQLMEEYGGRLSPAQEGEVPFVRPTDDLLKDGPSAKEKQVSEKAAAKAKRAAEKKANKQARADAKLKAKIDKAQKIKGRGDSKVKPVIETVGEATLQTKDIALEEQSLRQKETTYVSKTRQKVGRKFNIAASLKKVPRKQAAVLVVGGGTTALGYRLYDDMSVAKRNEQYRSIMGGDDDDDFEDDDEYDDDY